MFRIFRPRLCACPGGRLMQPFSTATTAASHLQHKQPRLPRLPVPKLDQTLQRYLTSLEPFLLEDEARGGVPFEEALALRKHWAEEFENGIGKTLQERLYALDKASPHNWLDDNIWLKKAYHEWRAPLIVNSNWWLSFKNDPTIPEDVYLGLARDEIKGTAITRWQVRRASWLLHRTLEFKSRLEKQEVYPDTTRDGLWFQRTIGLNFNTARIPRRSCDTFSPVPPSPDPSTHTVLVHIHDWQYSIDVLDSRLELLPVQTLEQRLLCIVEDAGRRLEARERAVPVGVLTSDERDRWAENLEHLLSLSPANETIFRAINHSIVALSLDPWTYVFPSPSRESASSSSPLPPPDSPKEVDAHLHNLRSSHSSHPAHNRWFDKPFTLIVESNGRAGANGEHSPCDALVPSIMAEYAVVQAIDLDAYDEVLAMPSVQSNESQTGWRRLDWVTDDRIKLECVVAEERARAIVQDSDDSVLWFDAYGAEWIKKIARLAPDAYIQMALQLAWYRTRGEFTATYETALTRLFHHARTETIRTLTKESRAWVLSMMDPNVPVETRRDLLHRALQTHSRISRAASTGRGIDRHLLGLRCMIQPEELAVQPALFQDELFTRSQTWKLSTSGLSPGDQFRGTGASEHDGYGINYLPGPSLIMFGIESKHSCPSTSTQIFKSVLIQVLLDMKELCSAPLKSHL
ncbi:unnamed protein product [Somion occarium]|uniref:Choline/carnitine acyltransferase domain-containing protein n=1 Tax=Somion occarium TaxID=3059160 RepID=A0ABP1EAH4_9APHY